KKSSSSVPVPGRGFVGPPKPSTSKQQRNNIPGGHGHTAGKSANKSNAQQKNEQNKNAVPKSSADRKIEFLEKDFDRNFERIKNNISQGQKVDAKLVKKTFPCMKFNPNDKNDYGFSLGEMRDLVTNHKNFAKSVWESFQYIEERCGEGSFIEQNRDFKSVEQCGDSGVFLILESMMLFASAQADVNRGQIPNEIGCVLRNPRWVNWFFNQPSRLDRRRFVSLFVKKITDQHKVKKGDERYKLKNLMPKELREVLNSTRHRGRGHR
ncbi:MAG: hypothetical protein LBI55_03975, partial [Oscillospiraceae bacterium]|nr:hypothetical protein [Oscillospiraceae bacterium]